MYWRGESPDPCDNWQTLVSGGTVFDGRNLCIHTRTGRVDDEDGNNERRYLVPQRTTRLLRQKARYHYSENGLDCASPIVLFQNWADSMEANYLTHTATGIGAAWLLQNHRQRCYKSGPTAFVSVCREQYQYGTG
jgi:hypothetical protein